MKKIAFFDAKKFDSNSFNEINNSYGFKIHYLETRLSSSTVKLANSHDAVCAFVNDIADKAVIDHLCEAGVKILGLRCAGFNNVDLSAAQGRLPIVRVPAYSPYAVAEHAACLMLALNRRIHKAYIRTRENNFSLDGLLGFDMHGKTAGVIGTGTIGRTLIPILLGFGMKVLAYDAFPDADYAAKTGINFVSLDELLVNSDIISLNCPLTKDTEHLINDESIKKMKRGVMIINTSRGKVVDTKALIAGLKTGQVGSAGLDVYEEEGGYFFEDKSDEMISDDTLERLITFPNVILTAHQAFFTKEALMNIAETTLRNFKNFFENGEITNQV